MARLAFVFARKYAAKLTRTTRHRQNRDTTQILGRDKESTHTLYPHRQKRSIRFSFSGSIGKHYAMLSADDQENATRRATCVRPSGAKTCRNGNITANAALVADSFGDMSEETLPSTWGNGSCGQELVLLEVRTLSGKLAAARSSLFRGGFRSGCERDTLRMRSSAPMDHVLST